MNEEFLAPICRETRKSHILHLVWMKYTEKEPPRHPQGKHLKEHKSYLWLIFPGW